jgi:UDP-N-acetylmuramoylalanine--D-glutamate ligase
MTDDVFLPGRPSDRAFGAGESWLSRADRDAPWSRAHVCIAGIGVSGFAAADVLCRLGARVTALDGRDGTVERDRARVLGLLGATVHLGDALTPASLPAGTDLVVTSPGWRPDQPMLTAATHAGIPVWGEVELAWRLRTSAADARPPAPWLAVTGTNGKTTTVQMLEAILRAEGLRAVAAGNVGLPLLDAVLAEEPYDVVAVELSSFQLHWSQSVAPLAAAVLNVAPDHLDWHGSLQEYTRAKGRVYQHCEVACIYNVADPQTERLVREADVRDGARAVGVTLGVPDVGMLGVVEDLLVDRAFVAERSTAAAELGALSDVRPPAPHNVENALVAAALARAYGVAPAAVREGLRSFTPDAHRIAHVATLDGVDWVDDSKATNAHAAEASLRAHQHVVWVAGGLAKGARFDDLARGAGARLRGAVLIGRDRADIAAALARHAPDVPVVEVSATDTGAMDDVVEQAARLARPGDTVLLAPACASMDMFTNYAERGDAFAAAVRRRGS